MPTTVQRLDDLEQELEEMERYLREIRELHARRKAEGKRVGSVRVTQIDKLDREVAKLRRVVELKREYGSDA